MRATISVERLPKSCGSYLIGRDAAATLGSIRGISDVSVDTQYLYRATLSYESADRIDDFEHIDQLMASKGLHRL